MYVHQASTDGRYAYAMKTNLFIWCMQLFMQLFMTSDTEIFGRRGCQNTVHILHVHVLCTVRIRAITRFLLSLTTNYTIMVKIASIINEKNVGGCSRLKMANSLSRYLTIMSQSDTDIVFSNCVFAKDLIFV